MMNRKVYAVPLVIIFVLTGCIVDNPPETETLYSIPTTVKTKQPTEHAVHPTSTEPNSDPVQETHSPSVVSTADVPTLSPEIAQLKAAEYLVHNGGCKLPCWWGVELGVTSVNEFIEDLGGIGRTKLYGDINGDIVLIGMTYMLPADEEGNNPFGSVDLYVENNVIGKIITNPNKHLTISEMIDDYGQPEEIWVRARELGDGEWISSIRLIYLTDGIAMTYVETIQEESNRPVLDVCFDNPYRMVLWWSGGLSLPRENIFENEDILTLPLSTATNESIIDFSKRVIESEGSVCIETEKTIWTE